jgi:glycerate-2-kinase
VRAHLEAGALGGREETPKPGHPSLDRVRTTLLASNRTAVEGARQAALRRGLEVRVVSEPLAGEASAEAGRLVGLARELRPARPTCLIAGGETTVTLRGSGRGGRSQELALAAALELDGGPPAALLAAGTDGTDGPTDAAGAHADEGSVERGARAGVDARDCLARNDSNAFFAAEGGLLVTGPTGTNVMDLVLMRVERSTREV